MARSSESAFTHRFFYTKVRVVNCRALKLKILLAIVVAAVLAGCQGQVTSAVSTGGAPKAPPDPLQQLHERARSGAFQLSSAVDSLVQALDSVHQLENRVKGSDLQR